MEHAPFFGCSRRGSVSSLVNRLCWRCSHSSGSQDLLDVLRREKRREGRRPLDEAKEAVGLLLVPLQSRQELLPLWWARRKRCRLRVVLIQRQRQGVALPL